VRARRFRSLREIGLGIGVPEQQLATDADRFAAFIPRLATAGGDRYGPAAAAALRRVVRLRAAGADDAAIAAELGRGPVALAPPASAVAVGAWDLASALNRRRDRRRRSLRALEDALRDLGEAAERHERAVGELREAWAAGGTAPADGRG